MSVLGDLPHHTALVVVFMLVVGCGGFVSQPTASSTATPAPVPSDPSATPYPTATSETTSEATPEPRRHWEIRNEHPEPLVVTVAVIGLPARFIVGYPNGTFIDERFDEDSDPPRDVTMIAPPTWTETRTVAVPSNATVRVRFPDHPQPEFFITTRKPTDGNLRTLSTYILANCDPDAENDARMYLRPASRMLSC